MPPRDDPRIIEMILKPAPDDSLNRVLVSRVLRVATDPTYPPMEYMQGGAEVGFDVEFARAIARELGVACRFEHVTSASDAEWDWEHIVKRLDAGKFDVVISGVMIEERRKQQVEFITYLNPQHVFVCRAGQKVEKLDDLKDKVVAVPKNTGTETLVNRLVADKVRIGRVVVVPGNYLPFQLVALGSTWGGADVTLAHEPVARYFEKRSNGRLHVMETKIRRYDVDSVGIALRKQDRKLKERIEEAINRIKDGPDWDELSKLLDP
jgi:polar amino acid transport system substrate-binding protein